MLHHAIPAHVPTGWYSNIVGATHSMGDVVIIIDAEKTDQEKVDAMDSEKIFRVPDVL